MQAHSRLIQSNQAHLHPKLGYVVRRHLQTNDRSPIAAHSREAYVALCRELQSKQRPLVLDSFCGTGHSTVNLAARHPHHLVVGIDKSERRLSKHASGEHDNYLLLRAPCEDIWRLLVAAGQQADFHYLLYPNPWPKAAHLQRRVHGHNSFPLLLQLGGHLELRSNWQIYVKEFSVAMHIAGQPGHIATVPKKAPHLSLFERKFRGSGHTLWSYTTSISP
ncbi:MAG: SAM-dependent methyltransferase [Halioglobus sp.]|nr:SAM-dependent methyltransferase [Halioglobus sp.]